MTITGVSMNSIRRVALACFALPFLAAAQQPAHAAWTRNAVIYEVNVRQYSPEGTIAGVRKQLPRLKALGVDILWMMPLQPIGVMNRKGPLGSPYSVSDYRKINPEFGTAADVHDFVTAAHRRGLRVILDWVPNHTAYDHPWITAHPDWYEHKADGSIMNARDNEGHETDWTDVAELNYDNPAMRRAMIADMAWWLRTMKIDGFRCDVAGGVPDNFWTEARRELGKVKPDLFMLAEAEAPAMHPAFDMTYGWQLHHLLNEIAQGKKAPAEIDTYLAEQARAYPADAYRMYFTSNHDENSWNGTEFERMGANNQPAFVLAATLAGSFPLLYTGQESGLSRRLKFFEKDPVVWTGTSYADFYHTLFALKHTSPALRNGAAGGAQSPLLTDGNDKSYAFTRTRGASSILVAVNFSDAPVHLTYRHLTSPGRYTDAFSHVVINFGSTGTFNVPPHGFRVLSR
jgi:glycosidase